MKQGKAAALALLLVLSVSALAYFGMRSSSATTLPIPTPQAQVPAQSPAPAPLTFPCRIVPRESVPVGTTLEGTIRTVLVQTGETVAEGQVLAEFDTGSKTGAAGVPETAPENASRLAAAERNAAALQREVIRARVVLALLEATFRKQEILNRAGATPRLLFEKAQSDRDGAAARLAANEEQSRQADNLVSRMQDRRTAAEAAQREAAQAARQTAAAEIHAPVAGVLIERNVAPGEQVVPQNRTALFRIVPHPELLRAEFDLASPLTKGQRISLQAGAVQISTTAGNSGMFADFESQAFTVHSGTPCSAMVAIK